MSIETLARAKYVSLTTFRRDGTPVATPVWLVHHDGEIRVLTGASSAKVRRLRNDPRVRVAPCDLRGRITGDAVDGTGCVLDPAESVITRAAIRKRYGLLGRLAFRGAGNRAAGGEPAEVGIAIRIDEALARN
jgi:PPOX class probable F420-dependent enzyme